MPPHVDPERRDATLARLSALRDAGTLTPAHIRLAAEGCAVSVQTVRRWMREQEQRAEAKRQGPVAYRLSEIDREAFAYFRGNMSAVDRARAAVVAGQRTAAGVPVPQFLVDGWSGAAPVSGRTLRRAFSEQILPAERALWREGEAGYRAAQVYLTRPERPRGAVWEMDHKNLPILVLPPRGPAVAPWLTTVIDEGSRALVGWAIAITGHSGTVLTAVRMALLQDPARGPFGAVPATVRIDRGLDFAAKAVKDVLAALVIDRHRLPGFEPHRKGKVERIHLTIDQTLLCTLPGFTEGPRDASGKLFGPLSDRAKDRAAAPESATPPMRIELFARRFAEWAHWYNHERPHSMIGDRPPVQAWNEDPSALLRVEEEQVRHLLLAGVERTIGKKGIKFRSFVYVAPQLRGRGGQRVQVRYMPHDDRFVEVYLDGKHLCTAEPAGYLSPEKTEEFRAHARAETKRLSAERRRAAGRTRRELVAMTGEGPAQESRLVPESRRQAVTGPAADAALRSRARTDLLGLHEPTAAKPKEQ